MTMQKGCGCQKAKEAEERLHGLLQLQQPLQHPHGRCCCKCLQVQRQFQGMQQHVEHTAKPPLREQLASYCTSMRLFASLETAWHEGKKKNLLAHQQAFSPIVLVLSLQVMRWRIQYQVFRTLAAILGKGRGRTSNRRSSS